MVAVLALAAAGCGVGTSVNAIDGPAPGATTTAARPVLRSTDPRAQFVHAPSVLGLPLRAARRRIAAARFTAEPGQRFGLEGRTGTVVTFGPDEADESPVVAQTPTHPQPSSPGQTVALGTVVPPIPARPRPTLEEVSWGRVSYEDGIVVLSRISWGGDCRKLDHVQVGRPGGAVRSVRVFAENQSFPVEAGCESRPTTIRLRAGNDWDPETSVWNAPLEQPRKGVQAVRRVRYARVTVQPDRRTVMVTYLRNACEALARATIGLAGRRATVDLRLGTVPPPADATRALCPSMASAGTTVVRMPRPLPPGTVFVDAPRAAG